MAPFSSLRCSGPKIACTQRPCSRAVVRALLGLIPLATLMSSVVAVAAENVVSGAAAVAAPSTQLVTVAENVKLEVVDWGGSGRPLVMLAGLGATAHTFDKFAPKLTANHHVYGITRRGFAPSSIPETGYSADQLGDDVLAVIDFLKLDRPVLVGHSLAGEELSSVGSRHPEKVSGLVYLDAGYAYAYYDKSQGDLTIDANDVQAKLSQLQSANVNPRVLVGELLEVLPRLQRNLQAVQDSLQLAPPPALAAAAQQPPPPPPPAQIRAIMAGQQKYAGFRAPILAIYAIPHDLGAVFRGNAELQAKAEAVDAIKTETQAKAFELAMPSARIVRLTHASHVVYRSNEADVLREMNAFLATLP